MKEITLGQYFPGTSFLYRLDTRIKILVSVLYIVAAFSASSHWAFLLLFGSGLLLCVLSGIPLRLLLKSIRPLAFILIFTSLLTLFMTVGEGEALFDVTLLSFLRLRVYMKGVVNAVFFALRILSLVLINCLFLTYTTTPTDLTGGIESLLRPLAKIKVPVYDFAMMMSISLRFLPTLTEETDRIMSAQKARGADFENGSLLRRAKALLPILIPLFVSAFRRAGELAVAMECRCYRRGEGRSRLNVPRLRFFDLFFLLLSAAFLAGIYLLNAYCPTLHMVG